jgi:hypothetical protein
MSQDLTELIYDELLDAGHNGLQCDIEEPLDFTAKRIADRLSPFLAKAWDEAHWSLCADASEAMDCGYHDNPYAMSGDTHAEN